MPAILSDSVQILQQKLSSMKSQMLDHKPFSIRQYFKLCDRVDSFLRQHFKLEELQQPDIFLSSSVR